MPSSDDRILAGALLLFYSDKLQKIADEYRGLTRLPQSTVTELHGIARQAKEMQARAREMMGLPEPPEQPWFSETLWETQEVCKVLFEFDIARNVMES